MEQNTPFVAQKFRPPDDDKERKKEKLEAPPSHHSAMTHATYLNDQHFKQCYPLRTKIYNAIKQVLLCRGLTKSFVDELHEMDKLNPQAFNITDRVKHLIQDKIIKLKILNTSPLELDTNIMHPFVKIHLVELTTGKYMTKQMIDDNAIYNFESNGVIELKEDKKSERKSCELEFIPPFATNCCDMRFTQNSRAVWNEEIYINQPAEALSTQDFIILFEILDFNPIFLKAKKSQYLDADHFYKVAWGYLRPMGLSRYHQGNIKIQLFKYQFRTLQLNQNERNECTPLVYFDFIWPTRQTYNGILNVVYMTTDQPQYQDVIIGPQNVFQIEKGDQELLKRQEHIDNEQNETDNVTELSEQDKINLRRRRFHGEKSQIPENIAFKLITAQLGCYRLCFNPKGNYLAAACTFRNSKTIIKLFDVENNGILFCTFKGHSNLVHDIRFSQQSQFLVTSSSDQTVKLWRVPRYSNIQVIEDESDQYLMSQLAHPSFVYSSLCLLEGYQPLIVTACFDSRIRIWRSDAKMNLVVQQDPIQEEIISQNGQQFDNFNNLLEHRHPNSMVYDGARRLYVGDSLGCITIYDINTSTNQKLIATRINFVVHPEMNGDPINSLCLVPPEYKDLLVHSRDNCIRILEVSSSESKYSQDGNLTGAIVSRLFGSVSQKLCIRSVMSPCGEFILSGSEDGKPYLWDNVTIEQPTQQFQYDLIGPVTDVAWNDTYHMLALSGFGDEHPIVVYTWERNDQMNLMEYKELQEKLLNQQRSKIRYI